MKTIEFLSLVQESRIKWLSSDLDYNEDWPLENQIKEFVSTIMCVKRRRDEQIDLNKQ